MGLLEENQVIRDGDYIVEKLIGVGFFAEVWRVKHRILKRQALKIFNTPGTLDEIEAMFEEARLLTGFGHRNVIRVFDAGYHETREGTRGFFTMEYLGGGNLEQFRLQHEERLVPVAVAVDILRQACLGLRLAHSRKPPVVHRDIKPQNILIDEDEEGLRACVSDFGLAKHVNPIMLKASTRGTPCYRAPECFSDPQAASCAADVWALGLTTYLMLTDLFPYAGADWDEINPKHFKRPLVRASHYNAGVNEVLDAIITRSLAIEPENRYPHVMALLSDLEEWQRQEERASLPTLTTDPSDERKARELLARAVKVSRADTAEAAKLLKRAMELYPPFREDHRGWLKALLDDKTA